MKETFKEILTTMGAVITYGDDGAEKIMVYMRLAILFMKPEL